MPHLVLAGVALLCATACVLIDSTLPTGARVAVAVFLVLASLFAMTSGTTEPRS